ncbi:MAG: Hpt domain-containing protein [Treponema sp.]|jgi:HPt (histidine-containing phosphotransfer) domain-containing protein|nr:Hpt domain-containing protein [Treponema sp.]
MADEPVFINIEEGVARVMNNAALYYTLLAKFRTSASLDDLTGFLHAGDYEKAQTSAHTIKGVAANLSLIEFFRQILELEVHIKARTVNSEQIETVKHTFDETIKEIDKVIAQNA